VGRHWTRIGQVGVGGAVGSSTMKNRVEVTTPAGETTLSGALTAAGGTRATTAVAVGGDIGGVATSPNSTSVTLARFVPVIVTIEPRGPLSGTKDVMVGRAIVGDGDGERVGVGITAWNVGSAKLGTAMVGGTGAVKLGGTVSDGDGSASDGDGSTDTRVVANAVVEGSTTTRERVGDALVDAAGAVPMTGRASCVSGEPLALAGLSRSHALRTSASASSAAKRPTTTRPKRGYVARLP